MCVGHSPLWRSASVVLTEVWAIEGALAALEAIEPLSTVSSSCPSAKEQFEVESAATASSTPSSQLCTLELLDIIYRVLELL